VTTPLALRHEQVIPTGHGDRPVATAEMDGRPVIVKRFADLDTGRTVWQDHRALWHSPAGRHRCPPAVPEPLACRPGLLVMEAVEGDPLGRRGDPGAMVERATDAAVLLTDLHRSGVVVSRRRPWESVLRSMARKAVDMPEAARVVAALGAARLVDAPLVVGHGDWSPRNVLASPAGLRMIDFDRMAMADPARDVTYWGAWAWATELIAGRPPTWSVADDYAARYADAARVHPVNTGAYRSVALLRIAHGWSALATASDLRAIILDEAVRQARA
jgi:hypothetical protein